MFRSSGVRRTTLLTSACTLASAFLCGRFSTPAGLICLAGGICTLALFLFHTRRSHKRVIRLADSIVHLKSGHSIDKFLTNDEGALGILENEVHAMAERLTEQSALLEAEKDALKDVLADISHQLKTPLTSMNVMTDLLGESDLPTDKRTEFLRNLKTSLVRMEFLVLALLKLAKIDAAASLNLSDTDACILAELAMRPLAILFDVKDQKIDRDELSPIALHCDPEWTTEALGNILKNAGEHAPEGSTIKIASGENPICKWISVTDEGAGIAAEDRPHLFRRFYRSKNATKDSIGIGLPLSLAIMRKQNGDIEVKNKRGSGATFILKFYRQD